MPQLYYELFLLDLPLSHHCMMGTQAPVGVGIPTPALDLTEDKDADLATPPGEETWDQLSDTRLFILGVAFFALWAGNVSHTGGLRTFVMRLILYRHHPFYRLLRSSLSYRRNLEYPKVKYNG